MSIYSTSTSGIFIGWANTSSVGTLIPSVPSELYIKAYVSSSSVDTKYKVSSGNLPNNITVTHDGLIVGTTVVNTLVTSTITTSNFSVSVVDNNNNHLITGDFSITVNQTTSTEYTNLYFKPLLAQADRLSYLNFVNDSKIFELECIYRYSDLNFGVAKHIRCVIDFGTAVSTLTNYAEVISQNFYKRKFLLGDPKIAVSKDNNGTVVYEIIYINVIDKNMNANNSIPSTFNYNNISYFPSSIANMRNRISSQVNVTDNQDPNFIKTIQSGESTELGYVAFVPICFTLPGKSQKILRNITNSRFSFNNINFDIDRIYIQQSQDIEGTKYLLLNRNAGMM